MSHRLRRRLSPSMIVALLALIVAMSGAAAAVLVSSPDQLADLVVTNPKVATDAVGPRALDGLSVGNPQLADGAVSLSKLSNPVLSAKVNADGITRGDQSEGVVPSQTRRVSIGRYEVTFDRPVITCAIVASPNGPGGAVRSPLRPDHVAAHRGGSAPREGGMARGPPRQRRAQRHALHRPRALLTGS